MKSKGKNSGSSDPIAVVPATGYNPISGTFHAVDASLVLSHKGGYASKSPFRTLSEFNKGGSSSGDSENPKEKTAATKQISAAEREKIRLNNEKKHQRARERKAKELHEQCSSFIVSRKLETFRQKLVSMGFPYDRANMALLLNDGKLEESVAWLFEFNENDHPTSGVIDNVNIDISLELIRILEIGAKCQCTKEEVMKMVIAYDGDIEKAEETLIPQKPKIPATVALVKPATFEVESLKKREQKPVTLAPVVNQKPEQKSVALPPVINQKTEQKSVALPHVVYHKPEQKPVPLPHVVYQKPEQKHVALPHVVSQKPEPRPVDLLPVINRNPKPKPANLPYVVNQRTPIATTGYMTATNRPIKSNSPVVLSALARALHAPSPEPVYRPSPSVPRAVAPPQVAAPRGVAPLNFPVPPAPEVFFENFKVWFCALFLLVYFRYAIQQGNGRKNIQQAAKIEPKIPITYPRPLQANQNLVFGQRVSPLVNGTLSARNFPAVANTGSGGNLLPNQGNFYQAPGFRSLTNSISETGSNRPKPVLVKPSTGLYAGIGSPPTIVTLPAHGENPESWILTFDYRNIDWIPYPDLATEFCKELAKQELQAQLEQKSHPHQKVRISFPPSSSSNPGVYLPPRSNDSVQVSSVPSNDNIQTIEKLFETCKQCKMDNGVGTSKEPILIDEIFPGWIAF
ncbi:hypothetical protein ACFE04_002146 [Oxalis oulophora]